MTRLGQNEKARKGTSVSDPYTVNPEPDPGSFALSRPGPWFLRHKIEILVEIFRI
jgi:hypothetical protein